jgi:hypothetical protein
MRNALATAGVLGAVSLACLGVTSTPAIAQGPQDRSVAVVAAVDADPVEGDGNSDSGKWGLAGLTGLFGLFGYKKYRGYRSARDAGPGTGSSRP